MKHLEGLKVRIRREHHVLLILSNSRHAIGRHLLLKEVVLVLQRDPLHEGERVGCRVCLGVTQLQEETIRHELNVLRHELRVHPNEVARERLGNELLLDLHCVADNLVRLLLGQLPHNLTVQKAGKVSMQPLVARDELITQGETRHEAALLEPEDSTECSAEEDALNSSKGEEAGGHGRLLVGNPLQSPLGLLLHTRNGRNGTEQVELLLLIMDIGVNKQRIGLTVNSLHHQLTAIEILDLRMRNLVHKTKGQVLHYDTVRTCEESEDILNKVSLVVGQLLPMSHILGSVNFLDCPHHRNVLLALFEDIWVVHREEGEAVLGGG